jgi:hypothetical protein
METTVTEEQGRQHEGQEDDSQGLGPRIQELKERIVSLNDQVKGFIKDHPAACLMGALGLGYLFARIARRSS